MTKRKRGRPSGVYVVGPDGEVLNWYEDYYDRYTLIIKYLEENPKTFRRRRTRRGTRVTFAETRQEYIERLIPAVRELARDVYGDPPPPEADVRVILAGSIPPDTHPKGTVNKKGLAQRILLYYHRRDLKHRTLKAVRDRVRKGKPRAMLLSLPEFERLFNTYTSDEHVDEATRNLPFED